MPWETRVEVIFKTNGSYSAEQEREVQHTLYQHYARNTIPVVIGP